MTRARDTINRHTVASVQKFTSGSMPGPKRKRARSYFLNLGSYAEKKQRIEEDSEKENV